jgi:demethylmenaquinone methyltransferase / 2-methoxy-6-polyprenyl-1,4-benzoquinol methylase
MADLTERDPRLVRGMFDGIAGRYDLLNRLLSLSLDRLWRRRAAEELASAEPRRVLDLCGGTGDLTVAVLRATGADLVVCCDFAHAMLERAIPKLDRAPLATRSACVQGDGLALPFRDGAFDAITVGFGVRNLANLDSGLREMARVLAPAGRLVVLEFSEPSSGLPGSLYRLYLSRILPRVGDSVSGKSGPYRYLARTIAAFPGPAILAGRIREAGFAACGWRRLSGGIVAIHTAIKGV